MADGNWGNASVGPIKLKVEMKPSHIVYVSFSPDTPPSPIILIGDTEVCLFPAFAAYTCTLVEPLLVCKRGGVCCLYLSVFCSDRQYYCLLWIEDIRL